MLSVPWEIATAVAYETPAGPNTKVPVPMAGSLGVARPAPGRPAKGASTGSGSNPPPKVDGIFDADLAKAAVNMAQAGRITDQQNPL